LKPAPTTSKTLLPDGGEVAVLEGLPSSTPAVERLNGFKDGVKANSKIQVVAEQAADWLPTRRRPLSPRCCKAHPDIKVVYASNEPDGGRLLPGREGRRQGRAGEGHRH